MAEPRTGSPLTWSRRVRKFDLVPSEDIAGSVQRIPYKHTNREAVARRSARLGESRRDSRKPREASHLARLGVREHA